MPKFSVIVPVYNVEREYLEAALKSMLSQTFTDWECICVDDGSTNDAGVVLDEFAAKDNRFKIFHTQNQGVGAARNLALDQANGTWIMFLDGDDLYMPNTIEEINIVTLKYPASKVIRFWYKNIGAHDTWTGDSDKASIDGIFEMKTTFPKSLVTALPVWEFAFHRQSIGKVRFCKYIMCEDTIFALECLKNAPFYAYTTKMLYGYRQRPTSVCHTISAKSHLDNFKSYVHRLQMFDDDSRKDVFYHTPSILRYLVHDYVVHISRVSDYAERQTLWNEWFGALGFLASKKEFPAPYHAILKICYMTHSKTVSYILCGIALAVAWRMHLPFARVINPHLDEDIPAKFIALDGVYVPGQ